MNSNPQSTIDLPSLSSSDHGPLTTDMVTHHSAAPIQDPASALHALPAITPPIHPSIDPSSLPSRPVTHSGKVAHLPAAIRNHVCQSIYDGVPYKSIIAWLAQNGHPGFHKSNLSRWRQGGYQDWLKAQQWFEHQNFKLSLALQQAKTDDPTFHDAAIYLAQIQFYELLNRLDTAELFKLVNENRNELTQLLKTFTHFNRFCLQRQKFRHEQDKTSRGKSARQPVRRLTVEKICDDMNLK